MASLSLIFDILARDRASKEFNNVGDAADRAGKRGHAFGVSMSKAAALASGAIAGIGIAAFAEASVKSYIRIERINAQTASAIKATGGQAQVTSQHIQDLTGSLENMTGTEAESIQQGANLLLTFTKIQNKTGAGNDIFDQATKAITDMSRALDTTGGANIDTSATAVQLGKALNDPIKGVTALQKVGVSFTKQQKDQIKTLVESGDTLSAQKIILKELNTEFGGAGEAFAKTTAGRIELAKHAIGTLGESIVGFVLPTLSKFAVVAANALNGLAEKWPAISGRIAQTLKPITDALGTVRDVAKQAFDILLHGDFTGGPLTEDSSVVDALFNIRDGFGKTLEAAKGFGTRLSTALGSVKTSISNSLDGANIDISAIGAGMVDQVQKFGQPIVDGLKKGLADGDYTQAGEAAGQALTAAIRGAATAAKNITEAIGELIDKVNWGELALRFGKQAPTLVLGFVTGVLNFDIGSVLKFLGDHWVEVLFAILAVAFAPAKIVGKVAEVLARIPLVGPFLAWGLRAFKTFSDNIVGFIGEMFGRFSKGFLQGGTGLISRFAKFFDDMFTYARVLASEFVDFIKALPGRLGTAIGDGLEAFGSFVRTKFDALWGASKTIALLAIGAIVTAFLNLVGTIIDGAANAFGWVPGLGDKLKDAAKHFDDFRDNVNNSLLGLKDKDIEIRAKLSAGEVLSAAYKPGGSVYNSQVPAQARAIGGAIYGAGTGTSDSIPALLSNGEHVWTAQEVKKAGGQQAMYAMRAAVRRFATGGGVSVTTTTDTAAGTAAMGKWYDGLVSKVTAAGQAKVATAASTAYSGPVPTGSAVTRWAPLVSQVLAELGLNGGLVGKVLAQIKTESGGNPNATQGNIGDVNNRSGDLARGLMQVIGATFRAYAGPYRALGQYDPHASIYAGLNYAMHRYGPNLSALGQGHGYARGGQVLGSYAVGTDWVPKTGMYELHKGEAVTPAAQNGKGRSIHIETIDMRGSNSTAADLRHELAWL